MLAMLMFTLFGLLWSLQMVDDHEELLSNSVARLERVRHKHERLSKILISVKAGVEHLQDKLKSTAREVGICRVVLRSLKDNSHIPH